MSYPVFKDFDKSTNDLFADDFDSKYSLKIKSSGPSNTTITTTTTYDAKENKIVPKVGVKWSHHSGFTLDKFELAPDCKMTVETSLSNVAEGLKLEFKGNDSDKGDLSATYSVPNLATFTGEFDFNNFAGAKASVNGGHGDFTGGACADVKIAKSTISSTTFGVGLGYTLPKQAFIGFRACDNFNKFTGLLTYWLNPNFTLAGKVHYSPKATTAILGTVYKCNPQTVIKVKADSAGVFSASVKQSFEKNFAVIGSAEIPSSFNSVKFGVNATLG